VDSFHFPLFRITVLNQNPAAHKKKKRRWGGGVGEKKEGTTRSVSSVPTTPFAKPHAPGREGEGKGEEREKKEKGMCSCFFLPARQGEVCRRQREIDEGKKKESLRFLILSGAIR